MVRQVLSMQKCFTATIDWDNQKSQNDSQGKKTIMVFFSIEKFDKFSESWGFALSLIFAGWFWFVAMEVYIERHFRDQNWSTSMSIINYSSIYFALLLVAVIVSFVVGKGVKKYRIISNAMLVIKAFWVLAAFLAFFAWSDYQAALRTSSSSLNENSKIQSIGNSGEMAKVTAVITRHRDHGLYAVDSGFNAIQVAALEDWLVETAISKWKNLYSEMGFAQRDFSELVHSSSTTMNIEGQELAIIKIDMHDIAKMVVIFGGRNEELVKVSCIRNSNHDVTVFSGPCGDKLYEAFGFRISP